MEAGDETIKNQLLSFQLRDEHFAVEITKVREVLDVTTLTKIPRMPESLSGVINLRGKVMPVIDLGLKLGMKPVENSMNTCIIIVDVATQESDDLIQIGLLSDSVQEVLALDKNAIEPTPYLGSNLNTQFIKGMGRHDDRFIILLDINRVVNDEDQFVPIENFSKEVIPTAHVELNSC